MAKLTAKVLDGLKPRDRRFEIGDDEVPGLRVRVEPNGVRRFGFRVRQRGRLRYQVVGTYPELSLAAARRRARTLRVRVDAGEAPAEERRRQRSELSLGELWGLYLERHVKPRKAESSRKNDESRWRRHLAAWGSRRPSEILRSDIVHLLRRLASECGPYEANRTLALTRHLFRWGRREELIDCANPAMDIPAEAEHVRNRELAVEDLKRLMKAISEEADPLWQGYFVLLILLGSRRSELLAARWEWLNLDHDPPVIVFPRTATKQRREHIVPLPSVAVQVLEQLPSRGRSAWLFPTETGKGGARSDPKRAWERIRSRSKLLDLRIHDLRHAVGASLGSAGANGFVIASALGHSQLATTARYVRPYLGAVHAALDEHGEKLRVLMDRNAPPRP